MAASDQFVDRLPDRGYDGAAALAYDAYLPPGSEMPDDALYRRVIAGCGGTALELGSGNGRFLVPARRHGLDVEGLDSSADMLERCRRNAAAAGVEATLHHGDMSPLTLDRTFAAIVAPAGTFTLIADVELAHDSLASYHAHLAPGGTLAFRCHTVAPGETTGFTWRLRRTGTDAETGITYVSHEATGDDDASPQTHLWFSRLEAYDQEGRLLDTWFRRLRLRWWTKDELTDALTAAGFANTKLVGDDHDWVAIATRS
jgi:SAM-dependent methyltransferase